MSWKRGRTSAKKKERMRAKFFKRSREPRPERREKKMREAAARLAFWWFIAVSSSGTAVTQGPFLDLAKCDEIRRSIQSWAVTTSRCWEVPQP